MADPRTYTVKQCEPAYAAKSGAGLASSSSQRRDFFNSVGKVGDLAVLNSVGGGKIGSGLRNLASISNSIRGGCGSIPSVISSSIDSGANWVLEQTGIAPTVINTLQGFNPAIANQAYGQAKQIYSQVKSGTFKAKDIPGYIQDFTNLERLATNIFTPAQGDAQTTLGEHCEASPYALDLIARAPKYKFLFVVQFIPDAAYAPLGSNQFGPLDMAFTVKHSTRPEAHFVHEDVNYYNFRTKVPTKTEFQDMTMTFHDDTLGYASAFYKAYLGAMSPITSIENPDSGMLQEGSMDFVDNTLVENQIIGSIAGSTYASSLGPLANDAKQIFREIRLFHVYDYGNTMDVYRFMNPRISTLGLDDLDMSVGNEGSELSMTFHYDYVFMESVQVNPDANGGKYNIGELQRGAIYPMRYNDGSSAVEGPRTGGIQPFGVPTPATQSCDPLNTTSTSSPIAGIGGVANQATTAVADLSTKFSKGLGGLFG